MRQLRKPVTAGNPTNEPNRCGKAHIRRPETASQVQRHTISRAPFGKPGADCSYETSRNLTSVCDCENYKSDVRGWQVTVWAHGWRCWFRTMPVSAWSECTHPRCFV